MLLLSQFMACVSAILEKTPPSSTCCASLVGHENCYCSFKNSPTFNHYITPILQIFSRTCNIQIPQY
ncbi:hypothetical protein ZOSMA_642G00010 [Zostera marina]|uniref:Bifunctional inhibitor/plant lipid transfer protein/seed storage helical domain-containing protein n=1 Tax=Zostera marina TaxID=29655 RepID=A0A0K9NUZ5_ZOSMR|nr:hypothetical protein ZOSMA_642G00010 [Zostera marina]